MTIDELLAKVKEMLDQSEVKMTALIEQAPEGNAKAEEVKALETEIESLKTTVAELIEQMAKPNKDNVDTDPDDNDPDPDAIPHNWKSFGQFLTEIYEEGPDHNNVTENMKSYRAAVHEKATQTAGADETGGTLIPTEFSNQILERVRQTNDVLQNATIIEMGSNAVDIPIVMGFDESQGRVFGNIYWVWKGEEQQYTASNFETGLVKLVLNECAGMARVSRNLMKYSPQSIPGLLGRGFNEGMSKSITRAALRGTGTGMPKGVLTSGDHTIEVAKETNQTNYTFILDNIGNMFARLYSPTDDIGAGTWYSNRTVVPQLLKLNQAVGTGGSNVFLVNQSVQEKPVYSLLGIPLKFNNQMSALGDAGDIGLFDWSQYLVGVPAGGLGGEMETSIHLYFDYGSTAFRFTFDMDAQPWWPSEFKPEYGDTQAPFITLAERKP